jgi:hypothetical protein
MKHLTTLCAIALTGVSLSACTERQSAVDLPPGQYHHVTRSTDSAGTSREDNDTTTVGVDAYGNKTAVVRKKTTTDPRGLFNKRTNESTTVIEER